MDQSRTPLFDHLQTHAQRHPLSFHVPGHKNGSVFPARGEKAFRQILALDQTEITGMDDLHDAHDVIDEAQLLAADLYKTFKTFFLVGGSTAGNLAMVMTAAKRGDKVLVQRNSHQSIFHGLELSGANPVYLQPDVDDETGLSLGVCKDVLNKAVELHPDAKAVFLTNPSYEGYGQVLDEHVKTAHKAGMIVCVDEAHGAHLIHRSPQWPQSALRAGADMVVHSAHKTLPAMTMASFLHINSTTPDRGEAARRLRMIQSSSPSYPLMASLDLARYYLAGLTDRNWKDAADSLNLLKMQLNSGPGWHKAPDTCGEYTCDPLKLTFLADKAGKPYEWQRNLESKGIFPELATPRHLLLTLPLEINPQDRDIWNTLISDSLTSEEEMTGKFQPAEVWEPESSVSEAAVSFDNIEDCETKLVPWRESKGLVAAETITPYPPGIPLILTGERISAVHLGKLEELLKTEASFQTGTDWIEKGILIFLYRGE